MKNLKTYFLKLPILLVVFIVMLIIGLHSGSFFAYSFTESTQPEKSKQSTIKIEDVRTLFPEAAKINEDALHQISVFNKQGAVLGYVLSSKPYSDSLTGFAGPVHFIMGIDTKNKLVGIKITEHTESPGYIDYIAKQGFFEKLRNKPLDAIINQNIDAVSGATMTTSVIIKALKQKAAEYNNTVIKTRNKDSKKKISNGLTLLVIAFSLSCFFFKRLRKYRMVLLLLNIAILGFLNGSFVSLFLLHGWILGGVPFLAQPVLALIVMLAIVMPVFTHKNYYCNYLCPYGSLQELAAKLNKRRRAFPFTQYYVVKHLRVVILLILTGLLVAGVTFDLTNVEPFSAFVFMSASVTAIVLAVVFLIASVFYNKPWCNYFCPSGALLDFLKGERSN